MSINYTELFEEKHPNVPSHIVISDRLVYTTEFVNFLKEELKQRDKKLEDIRQSIQLWADSLEERDF